MATNLVDAKGTMQETKPAARPADHAAPVVLDFGKHRRKAIKQLRKGDGKLMDEISGALAELQTSGAIGAGAQPVIIIVQQKRRKGRGLLPAF